MGLSIKKYAKRWMSYGLGQATDRWCDEWALSRRHRRERKKAALFLHSLPIKLHLGCGPNRKEGWVNVDLFDRGADLQLDLREPWPFPDHSVSYIYSEHVLEHFELHTEVPHFLHEAFRILQPGGVFNVGVPDTEEILRAYRQPQSTYWSTSAKRFHPDWCRTELDHINYHFRQDGEHQYAWDGETLSNVLQDTGFTDVQMRGYDPSFDSAFREFGSLSMTAVKPRVPHK
jgi:SAM-dependent methyltransferase